MLAVQSRADDSVGFDESTRTDSLQDPSQPVTMTSSDAGPHGVKPSRLLERQLCPALLQRTFKTAAQEYASIFQHSADSARLHGKSGSTISSNHGLTFVYDAQPEADGSLSPRYRIVKTEDWPGQIG